MKQYTKIRFYWYAYCLNNPLIYTDPSGNYFFLAPGISYSMEGGWGVSLTGGIGVNKILSAQVTVGYDFGANNFYVTVGASLCCVTAYAGYGTQSEWFCGVGAGFGSFNGLSTNMTNIGANYSQNGGYSYNISCVQFDNKGEMTINPSIGYSKSYPLNRTHMSEKRFNLMIEDDPHLPRNADGSIDYTSENARIYWMKFKLDEHIRNFYTNGEGANSYFTYVEGAYSANGVDGKRVKIGGAAPPIKGTKLCDIYLSRSSFESQYKLYLIMGHESIHVSDYATGLMKYRDTYTMAKSEIKAYEWSMDNSSWSGGYYKQWENYVIMVELWPVWH